MAVDATPKLKRRSTVLAKIETTTGTAETLADTDGAFNIYNPAFEYQIPAVDRPAQASFGKLESVTSERYGTVTFESDLVGKGASGAVPGWASTFLPACGFTATGATYNLAYNASQPTLTIGLYIDGVKFAIAGAAGSVSIALTSGAPGRLSWRFMGKVIADSDVALVTPTAFATLPPRFAGNTVTLAGSYTPYLSSIEIDVNNTLAMRPFQGDLTGGRACIITGREPTISCDPELQLVASRDWYTILTANTAESLSAAVGVTANNIITLASTYAQWLQIPANGERNGLATRAVSGQLLRDSLSIAFT